jgi:hypothetical protein
MRRRDFMVGVLLAASAVTSKQATLARDRPKMPRVGYLGVARQGGHARSDHGVRDLPVEAPLIFPNQ